MLKHLGSFFLVLTLGLFGSVAHADPSPPRGAAIRIAFQDGTRFCPNSSLVACLHRHYQDSVGDYPLLPGDFKLNIRRIDLDSDPKTEEYLARVDGWPFCGKTGNCPNLVFAREGSTYWVLLDHHGTSLSVGRDVVHGHRDLVGVGYGGGRKFTRHHYEWSGDGYVER